MCCNNVSNLREMAKNPEISNLKKINLNWFIRLDRRLAHVSERFSRSWCSLPSVKFVARGQPMIAFWTPLFGKGQTILHTLKSTFCFCFFFVLISVLMLYIVTVLSADWPAGQYRKHGRPLYMQSLRFDDTKSITLHRILSLNIWIAHCIPLE